MVHSLEKVVLQPWAEDDLPLLLRLMGDPQVMAHLGGPETPDQILHRHKRYIHLPEDGIDRMFKIAQHPSSMSVGSIGYWKKTWRDQTVYETGWLVLPEYQGRGIATKAARAIIQHMRSNARYPFLHAFPSVENKGSNAICRKLGFEWIEECQFEYPPGRYMKVNDWRLSLLQV